LLSGKITLSWGTLTGLGKIASLTVLDILFPLISHRSLGKVIFSVRINHLACKPSKQENK